MEKEIWKDVVGYEGLYLVSNHGRIQSADRMVQYKTHSQFKKGKVMTPSEVSKGYLQVGLYRDKKVKRAYVHRLVAEAFIPNDSNLEQVNHIDADKTNNNVGNLEWSDGRNNIQHALLKDLRSIKLKKSDVERIRSLDKTIYPNTKIAEMYGITEDHASKVRNKRAWTEV